MNIKRHLFEFILDNHTRWNVLPTRSELRRVFAGWSDDLDLHLEQLEREGLLRLGKEGNDSIALVPTFPHAQQIGLCSEVMDKLPRSDGTHRPGYIALDLRGVGIKMEDGLTALLVGDDSMSDAGLKTGDIAIVHPACPQRGDIAAVLVARRLVLRRFVIVASIPHLLAENPLRPELVPAYESTFHGVLWGLIRMDPSSRICRVNPNRASYLEAVKSTPEEQFEQLAAPYAGKIEAGADFLRPVKSLSKPAKRKKASRQSRERKKPVWPGPINGPSLNDKTGGKFRTAPFKPILDEQPERPYNQHFEDMLAESVRFLQQHYE